MTPPDSGAVPAPAFTVDFHPRRGDPALAARLRREIRGDVLFDAFSRGRYATDASIYQIEPVGVVVPRTEDDARTAIRIAIEEGVPVLPRGAGTSQCGQTVGAALVIDNSKYLKEVVAFDAAARTVCVQPGMVLDQLNAFLKPHGLWYPVDVSTAAQATIGGMAGNNSCGSRSIHYGNMVHNVRAIDAVLADGSQYRFGDVGGAAETAGPSGYAELVKNIRALAVREADEIAARYPALLRRVGGYNLDLATQPAFNMARLLVGSEGTLAYSQRIHLNLQPIPRNKTLGVCHFDTFHQAMDSAQHLIKLKPMAVELVDRTMIDLARGNPAFKPIIDQFLQGEPAAILLVEFAADEPDESRRRLKQLVELMGDLGFPERVVEITDQRLQGQVWSVRKAGLNIMMSMKGDGKPVSFIEDCAVPLEHLAEYTDRLTRVFEKHGTRGTWYAHASVGCLHVRPVLNMKQDGAAKMRAIAEEAAQLVREYKGAYSGEHGDGLVRSEWIAPFFGPRLTRAFEDLKALFDPAGLFNPGKIVRPPQQNDRSLFRYRPDYAARPLDTVLDWSEFETGSGQSGDGFARAIEMCNNNGHCRKFDAGTMCPSYRATGDERHLTRGRANTLRLALSGQLGPDAFTSDEMYATLDLCVGCKGCRRECPTGVDMAKMKIEFMHHYVKRHGLSRKDRLIAYLPRYAPYAARFAPLLNLRNRLPGLPWATEKLLGFSARRSLPEWRRDWFRDRELNERPEIPPRPPLFQRGDEEPEVAAGIGADDDPPLLQRGASGDLTARPNGKDVALFVDTFNRYFEPENARAAVDVLQAAGYHVQLPRAAGSARPLCCGRTFLASGLIDEAKVEARRMLEALTPFIERSIPIVGLEPSCLLTLRDEYRSLLGRDASVKLAQQALLFEEFLAREAKNGKLDLKLNALPQKKALLHGHCHQKAFNVMGSVSEVLGLIPGLEVETIESSCCGMAGAFGYDAEHFDVSMKMAEISLLPKVRSAGSGELIVADGTSCRHQIHDGSGRGAQHVARVLHAAL